MEDKKHDITSEVTDNNDSPFVSDEGTDAPAEAVLVSSEEEAKMLDEDMESAIASAQGTTPQPKLMFNFVDEYMANTFVVEKDEYKKYKDRKTGFPNIDKKQPFVPGLLLLAGGSGSGKTTFAYQLAEQVAEAGTPVLYFSLEQSTLELVSKSLSRRIFQHHLFVDDTYQTYTSFDIRIGNADGSRELNEQVVAYRNAVKNNLCIVQCNHDLTIEFVIDSVRDYIRAHGVKPTIIIDYLQIMSPSVINGRPLTETKANVDHVVHALKAFQMSRALTVVAICSLNRASYLTAPNLASLKESGNLEFTADTIASISYSIVDEDSYYYKESLNNRDKVTETNNRDKQAMLDIEKMKSPRAVQYSILKNRNGFPGFKANFEYYCEYDTFVALDEMGNQYKPDGSLVPGVYLQQKMDEKKRVEDRRAEIDAESAKASDVIDLGPMRSVGSDDNPPQIVLREKASRSKKKKSED